MADMEEKLTELIQSAVGGCATYWAGVIADHLIANGVTFAKDNNVPTKWISVEDRLPGKQHDWVLVACKFIPEGWRGVPHIAEFRNGVWWADCHDAPLAKAGVEVTHWMPLPEPPDMRGKENGYDRVP